MLTMIRTDIMSLDLSQLTATLCKSFGSRIMRYQPYPDRLRSAVCYNMLQRVLCSMGCKSNDIRLCVADNGKPYLLDTAHIHFSLSHSGNSAACCVAEEPTGIDIEDMACFDNNYLSDMAAMSMNDNELHEIFSHTSPTMSFLRIWTRKEAYLKLTGEGLRNDMRGVLNELKGIAIHTQVIEQRYIFSRATYIKS